MKPLLLIAPILLTVTSAFADCDLQVARVSDGDTFHADTQTVISKSLTVPESTGFRLLRVYAPEKKEPGYDKAKADLTALLGGKAVEIRLPVKGRVREKYGRFLVEVFLCTPEGKINVNDRLRALGWVDKGKGVPK
ncbi:MAG TPA: hypothetical protein VGL11_07500 [Candidatus Binatia bacterium]